MAATKNKDSIFTHYLQSFIHRKSGISFFICSAKKHDKSDVDSKVRRTKSRGKQWSDVSAAENLREVTSSPSVFPDIFRGNPIAIPGSQVTKRMANIRALYCFSIFIIICINVHHEVSGHVHIIH